MTTRRKYRKKSPQIVTETDVIIIDKTIENVDNENRQFSKDNNRKQNKNNNQYKNRRRNKNIKKRLRQNHVYCYNNMKRSKLVKEKCVNDDALRHAESILNNMVDFSEQSKAFRSMMKLFSTECPEAMIYITSNENCSSFIMYSTGDKIAKHFNINDLVDIYYNFKQKKYEIVLKNQ